MTFFITHKPPIPVSADGLDEGVDFMERVNLAIIQDVLDEHFNDNAQLWLGGDILDKGAENYPQMLLQCCRNQRDVPAGITAAGAALLT